MATTVIPKLLLCLNLIEFIYCLFGAIHISHIPHCYGDQVVMVAKVIPQKVLLLKSHTLKLETCQLSVEAL